MVFTNEHRVEKTRCTTKSGIFCKLTAAAIIILGLSAQGLARADSGSYNTNFSLSAIEYSMLRAYANRFEGLSKTHSGTIAFSLKDKRNEIALPFLWHRGGLVSQAIGEDSNLFSMDLQFRRYGNDRRSGAYAGLATRFTSASRTVDSRDESTSLLGVGVTIGYRHVYQEIFYANVGMTWIHNVNGSESLDSLDYGVNSEFLLKDSVTFDILKIGILFD